MRIAGPGALGMAGALERAGARLADSGDGDEPGWEHAGDRGDHTDMERDMPGGVPMADRGADRDGLALDQLHVPIGPLLPDWPAGLVVRTVLQGDVIQEARIEVAGDHAVAQSFWNAATRPDDLHVLGGEILHPSVITTVDRVQPCLHNGKGPEAHEASVEAATRVRSR